MRRPPHGRNAAAVLLILLSACGRSASNGPTAGDMPATGDASEHVVRFAPGPGVAKKIQEALIVAQPGDVIELAEGRYEFESALSSTVQNITLRGAGMDKTILNFARLRGGTGGEGVSIHAGGAVVSDLAIEDVPEDGLKIVTSAGNVAVRRVRVEWTHGASKENGDYGIYPVMSNKVLVEDCIVRGAADAGIYVGQSTDVVVRRNRVEGNVAGIEIENCLRADVYDNDATDNAGGILVFSLPDLLLGQGTTCRVFGNRIVANNHENFADEGNIVGLVPAGTGMMVMAYDRVEVFDNTLQDNQTVNLAIVSYEITENEWSDPYFVPYSRAVQVQDNTFAGGGDKPSGLRWTVLAALLGGKLPDIAYVAGSGAAAQDDAGPDEPPLLSLHGNGDADFVSIVLQTIPKFDRDATAYLRPIDRLPAVDWEGLK